MKKLVSIRMSEYTRKQLEELAQIHGNHTEVVALAIDRMYREDKKMDEKFEITLGEDLDGFLGNDPDAIAKIDIEASQENYMREVRKAVREIYPNLVVEFAWGGSSNYTTPMFVEPETYEYLQDDLANIEERIYESQAFWVEK